MTSNGQRRLNRSVVPWHSEKLSFALLKAKGKKEKKEIDETD